MKKEQLKRIIKNQMKELGFQYSAGKYFCYLDDSYVVGLWLEAHPYCKGFFINYGVVYLPDEDKIPFRGWCDWEDSFLFSKTPNMKIQFDLLDDYNANQNHSVLSDYIEFEEWNDEVLSKQISENFDRRFFKVFDKEYVINLYRNNWVLFRMIPYKTVKKIASLAELNYDEVVHFRDYGGTKPK